MTSKLDQSLDSIISENRQTKSRRPARTNNKPTNNQSNNRPSGPARRPKKQRDDTPYSRAPAPVGFTTPFDNSTAAHLAAANFAAMQQQMQLQLAAQQKAAEKKEKKPAKEKASKAQTPAPSKKITGDTIHISNLAKDVTTDDIREIFEKVGEIRSCAVNYNEAGQSLGTATVTFKQSADAEKAMNDYDAAEVDGKPMYIKLVGTVSHTPVVIKKKKVEKPAKKEEKAPVNGAAAVNPAMNPLLMNPAMMNPAMMNFGATFPFVAPHVFNGPQLTNRSQSANNQSNKQSNRPARATNRTNNQSSSRGGNQSSKRGGRGRTTSEQPSLADLDAELDSYHK